MINTLPTVSVKGNLYVLVKDRVAYFNEKYPNGMIQTKVEQIERGLWISEAIVTPDYTKPSRFFTGHSQAREDQSMINKTAAAENCETSSVGRALALMGIGVVESIASADEVVKAITQAPTTKAILANAQAKRESGMTLDHVCLEHNVQMKERKSPAGGTYYDSPQDQRSGGVGTMLRLWIQGGRETRRSPARGNNTGRRYRRPRWRSRVVAFRSRSDQRRYTVLI